MTFDGTRAAVLGGDGVVARFPGIVCVARCADPAPVAALLEICRETAGPDPGRALARRLAMWLGGTDAPPDTLVFGTVAAAGDSAAAFLRGPVDARIGDTRLRGTGPDTGTGNRWTDRLVPHTGGRVRLVLDGAQDPGPHPVLNDLRDGVVAGAGIDLADVPAPGGPAPSVPAPPESVNAQSVHAQSVNAQPVNAQPTNAQPTNAQPTGMNPIPDPTVGPDPADDGTGPIPSVPPTPVTGTGGPQPGEARGHLCANGHLNDPRSPLCGVCGVRMNERTGVLVTGSRPPLGRLVFDDGATFPVDAEYLVGRLPDSDERVRAGTLRPIVVEDRTGAVSRVHAEVRVVGWDVVLVDSGSRNGTFVAAPGDPAWTPVPQGRSLRLLPGARVRMGARTFVFETPSAG